MSQAAPELRPTAQMADATQTEISSKRCPAAPTGSWHLNCNQATYRRRPERTDLVAASGAAALPACSIQPDRGGHAGCRSGAALAVRRFPSGPVSSVILICATTRPRRRVPVCLGQAGDDAFVFGAVISPGLHFNFDLRVRPRLNRSAG